MPSFIPLSMLSTRRTRIGSRSSEITEALKAASVGARLAPIKPASAIGRLGYSTTASAVPAMMESGSADPEQAGGQGQIMTRRGESHLRGVAEQQEPERDLRQVMHRRVFDVDAHDPPARIREEETGRQQHQRARELVRGQPLRQDRPAEDDERNRDQCGFVHTDDRPRPDLPTGPTLIRSMGWRCSVAPHPARVMTHPAIWTILQDAAGSTSRRKP